MRKYSLMFFLLLASGCTTPPPMNFSVSDIPVSKNKINYELRSSSVVWGSPGELKGEVPTVWATDIQQEWNNSLENAINRAAIFTDDSDRKTGLSVKILQFDAPGMGVTMTTYTTARYELIDRKNGTVIFTKDISTEGVVPPSYAFYGLTRALESINRAVQNNVAEFISQLQKSENSNLSANLN